MGEMRELQRRQRMAAEREARAALAAAFRLAVRMGLHEGVCNHFTLRLPGSEERFLLNRFGLHWSEVSASNLLVLDAQGRVLEGGRLEMAGQNALRFYGDVAYYDEYHGLVVDPEEGDRVARALGEKRCLFLASHGVIVVGPSVAEAFDLLYYLERACQAQVLAMSTARALRRVAPEVARDTYRLLLEDNSKYAGAHFAALRRILDREEPGYAR